MGPTLAPVPPDQAGIRAAAPHARGEGHFYCKNNQTPLGLGKWLSYTQLPSLHGFGMDASLLLKLDIFTLMIMALCGYCLAFLTLSIIRVTHHDIPGVGVWWWSSLFAMLGQAGFASLLLTPTPYGSWVGNVFLIFHVLLLLVAQRCFFRQSPGWRGCWGFILLFALIMTWSVAIDGRIAVRVMISSTTFLLLSTLIIWQLWRHGRPDYQVAVWVLIGLNLVLIAMTLMRMSAVWGEVIESPFQRQLFNVLPYVSMLVGSSMLTFGVLLLCNQHRALELRYQASHDLLTGLSNRRGFMAHLQRTRVGRHGSLVLLDLDDFKQINDRHGHEIGDRVLEQVGRTLQQGEGVLVSRFGGEEFVLLFNEQSADRVLSRCEVLQHEFANREVAGLRITVSMGVAHWQGEWHFDSLFRRADEALYRAKREGKNRVCQAV